MFTSEVSKSRRVVSSSVKSRVRDIKDVDEDQQALSTPVVVSGG
jgi:hypothetical protein